MTEQDTVQPKSTPPSHGPVPDKSKVQPHEGPRASGQKRPQAKTEEYIDDLFDNMPV